MVDRVYFRDPTKEEEKEIIGLAEKRFRSSRCGSLLHLDLASGEPETVVPPGFGHGLHLLDLHVFCRSPDLLIRTLRIARGIYPDLCSHGHYGHLPFCFRQTGSGT